MTLDSIELWHRRARPNPTDRDFQTQLGCHLEEFVEMLECLRGADTADQLWLKALANKAALLSVGLKEGAVQVEVIDRKGFLDALADQVVTAVGTGHCAGMQTAKACERVSTSNWTKTVDGEFQRDANGKIMKPATYVAPDLEGLY